ncbi:hypothetical protein UY3_11705 [Chelonia mydas]|uniref:Uncharacterized protein n=1 Tax=Chelonia mydas TaxID=8469 RepID=M7B6N7_CHEMY|nr:hypothetical protein UY3_11705 [Chelonia mydas]
MRIWMRLSVPFAVEKKEGGDRLLLRAHRGCQTSFTGRVLEQTGARRLLCNRETCTDSFLLLLPRFPVPTSPPASLEISGGGSVATGSSRLAVAAEGSRHSNGSPFAFPLPEPDLLDIQPGSDANTALKGTRSVNFSGRRIEP